MGKKVKIRKVSVSGRKVRDIVPQSAPAGSAYEEPEMVTARRVEKETKVVYNITEITNRGKKTHRQLEVASGSALEAEMDAQVAETAGVANGE